MALALELLLLSGCLLLPQVTALASPQQHAKTRATSGGRAHCLVCFPEGEGEPAPLAVSGRRNSERADKNQREVRSWLPLPPAECFGRSSFFVLGRVRAGRLSIQRTCQPGGYRLGCVFLAVGNFV